MIPSLCHWSAGRRHREYVLLRETELQQQQDWHGGWKDSNEEHEFDATKVAREFLKRQKERRQEEAQQRHTKRWGASRRRQPMPKYRRPFFGARWGYPEPDSPEPTPVEVKHNWYEILGIETRASVKDIRGAFRKKALQFHPDKNPGNAEVLHLRANVLCMHVLATKFV